MLKFTKNILWTANIHQFNRKTKRNCIFFTKNKKIKINVKGNLNIHLLLEDLTQHLQSKTITPSQLILFLMQICRNTLTQACLLPYYKDVNATVPSVWPVHQLRKSCDTYPS